MEYWYSRICDAYIIASNVTGDLLEDVNENILEFSCVADVLAAFPSATLSETMGEE